MTRCRVCRYRLDPAIQAGVHAGCRPKLDADPEHVRNALASLAEHLGARPSTEETHR